MSERIALVGPTAAGKTAVALALAQTIHAEIVSADSMQVYRGMDIGTAKPTPAERAQVPFHAVDVADPDDEWTLADFQQLGEAACADICARGRTPLIVGGTGLYVRALTTRLDIPLAPPDAAFRAKWRALAAEHGNGWLQAEIARVDPQAAARIHVNDVGRLVRALEVYETHGVSLSELHAQNKAQASTLDVRLFGLTYANRDTLYESINARVDAMLAAGFVDEVRGLLDRGCGRGLKPMQSLGYRHMGTFLAGECRLEDATQQMQQDTRRFARRQLIWFRADPRIHWLEAEGQTPAQVAATIAAALREPSGPETASYNHSITQGDSAR